MGSAYNKEWSDAELSAAVDAYVQMLHSERDAKPYNKADVNRALRHPGSPLVGRTKSSIEFRMQNISAVLESNSVAFLKGYAPARNVGPKNHKRIEDLLRARKIIL